MINEYNDRRLFGNELAKVVSPAKPIDSIERLHGRELYLDQIEKAFFQPGRHVFIYGDRGVGKSSLGSTAAYIHQSPDASPIIVGGSKQDTFNTIVSNIIKTAIGNNPFWNKKLTSSGSISSKIGGFSLSEEMSSKDISQQINTVNDAASLLEIALKQHSKQPIVLLDEFDAISNEIERGKFAELLKCLGDRGSHIKFIFTAVGLTLDELLGAHQSSHRQLACIQLPRLSFEGRRALVSDSLNHFNLDIDDNVNWRIAMISDGFPYYIHIILEHIFWACHESEEKIEKITWDIYRRGLVNAINAINVELKRPYEKAIHTNEKDVEYVLWATADGEDTHIDISQTYQSHERITRKKPISITPSPKEKVSRIIAKLKTKPYGEILKSMERRGWFTYKDMIFRGYVRIQAEANGVELNGDRVKIKHTMHIPSARTGYVGSRPPPGVNLTSSNEEEEN